MFQRTVQGCWLPTPFASFPFTSPTVRHRVPSGSIALYLKVCPQNGGFETHVSQQSFTVQIGQQILCAKLAITRFWYLREHTQRLRLTRQQWSSPHTQTYEKRVYKMNTTMPRQTSADVTYKS